jgi:hypothetical protein
MGQIFQSMTDFFIAEGWPVEREGDMLIYISTFKGIHGEWKCRACAKEEIPAFVFYSLFPFSVPEEPRECRPRTLELIDRINSELLTGCFDLDLTDGSLRFRTGIETQDGNLDSSTLRSLVYNNVRTMDKYFQAFKKLIEDPDLEPGIAQVSLE